MGSFYLEKDGEQTEVEVFQADDETISIFFEGVCVGWLTLDWDGIPCISINDENTLPKNGNYILDREVLDEEEE